MQKFSSKIKLDSTITRITRHLYNYQEKSKYSYIQTQNSHVILKDAK